MGNVFNVPMFCTLLRRVEYGNTRMGVINENLANLNTPDYRVMDLVPMSVRKDGTLALMITHKDHKTNASIGDSFRRKHDIEATRPDGHININEQLVKLQETHAENTLMLNSLKKFTDFHRTVLRG